MDMDMDMRTEMDKEIISMKHQIDIPFEVYEKMIKGEPTKLVFEIIDGRPYYFDSNYSENNNEMVTLNLFFNYRISDKFNVYIMDNARYENKKLTYYPAYFMV